MDGICAVFGSKEDNLSALRNTSSERIRLDFKRIVSVEERHFESQIEERK